MHWSKLHATIFIIKFKHLKNKNHFKYEINFIFEMINKKKFIKLYRTK